MDVKNLINKYFINSKKKVMNLIILLLCGVLMILIADISSNLTNKKVIDKESTVEVNNEINTNTQNTISNASYEESIKKELLDTLSTIEGVGKISVMIYFEGGVSEILAMNNTDSNKRTEEKDNEGGLRVTTENDRNENVVLVNQAGETKPFVLKRYNPIINGVVIVAEGAYDSLVRQRLLMATRTVLNLSSNKVSIMPMERNNEK